MSLTLAAAAAAAGVNKTTLLRAIKAGKVSGNKDEHGQWHIEPAELQRVYPPVTQRADTRAVQRSLLGLPGNVSPKSHTGNHSTVRLPVPDSPLPKCLTP